MEKIALNKQFAYRLKEALLLAGFSSGRSTSGVDIHKLADITGYSSQICRKYLRGEAIPEASKLVDIAEGLNVSPGWLLFGEQDANRPGSSNKISISKNLLHYIFLRANELYNDHDLTSDVAGYLMDLSYNVSKINASDEESKKIIDLALSSAKHFNRD
jgi:transcriptional regulator with XRE-family HTH domain